MVGFGLGWVGLTVTYLIVPRRSVPCLTAPHLTVGVPFHTFLCRTMPYYAIPYRTGGVVAGENRIPPRKGGEGRGLSRSGARRRQ